MPPHGSRPATAICPGGGGHTAAASFARYKEAMIRLGYPTKSLRIPASTNRTLRLANLLDVERVQGLVREEIAGLRTIMRLNAERGVDLFRMGQSPIPFASHPAFPYDWEAEHGDELREAGELSRSLGIRLSMHPGQYIQPASLRPEVVGRSLAEVRSSARIFSLAGGPRSVLVLHLGRSEERRAGKECRSRWSPYH